jgi:hypothetical protein
MVPVPLPHHLITGDLRDPLDRLILDYQQEKNILYLQRLLILLCHLKGLNL